MSTNGWNRSLGPSLPDTAHQSISHPHKKFHCLPAQKLFFFSYFFAGGEKKSLLHLLLMNPSPLQEPAESCDTELTDSKEAEVEIHKTGKLDPKFTLSS